MSESFVDRALHVLPFWALAVAVFAGMALAAAIGWRLRVRQDRKPGRKAAKGGEHEDLVLSSVMGLLALLIGFTFSLAIDRFDTRRERVLAEANAIGTTYLRTQLLEEPHRARISGLLVQYTDLSLALAQARPGDAQRALLRRNDALIVDLWAATEAAFPSIRPYDFSSSYLESMNGLIDLNAARQQARRARVPTEIFVILYFYQFIAAGAIGYVLIGKGGLRTGTLLLFLFGLALVLVIDVDYPNDGGINVSQEPMQRLRATLATWPPDVFGKFGALAPASGPSGRAAPQ